MKTNVKVSLDMNEKWRKFLHEELKKFAIEHPECKFEIICWTDDLVIETAHVLNDYLAENQCPSILTTGGRIIGKGRTSFYNYIKRKVL